MTLADYADQMINSAFHYLKETNQVISPETHLAQCQQWQEALMNSTDPEDVARFDALGIAIDRIRISMAPLH